ncbi:hypothetical protein [Clostridium algidicarnis]|uniref:hypothetical protein n=1 Tax=Clostridium algidicarnis TaxID=37659 RepID=UPI001C0B25ED|nr:hypothetical protein [Clostridium algidicarnis]MBU3202952.1 hypothetical protein [Clostridium algidicarnis]MBU3211106.1 hypothetical protein [Clostridium algidicarnis]MBU3222386.1 hypothetical protein [Clostridium algidicarnis]
MNIKEVKILKSHLTEYKEVTLDLIKALEEDNIDKLDPLLEKRQDLINHIESQEYDNEIFKDLCTSLKIIPLQSKLSTMLNEKKSEVKEEIDNIADLKSASKSYNKRFSVDSIYFNKKI